jgi:NAD(P)-dependent dehydrogenase (short-subunit alcohol dehydrogenase family)
MAIGNRLVGRVALVTGAGSGIGRAIARRFAEEGAWVGCLDRDRAAAEAVVPSLANGGRALVADVSREDDVRNAIAGVHAERGRLDIVVNSAGIAGPQTAVGVTPLDEWQRTLDINLTGTFLVCKHALARLVESRGNIVNVASALALIAKTDEAAYHASKAGVVHMSKSMALDYATQIRVNCVCPGAVRTPMIESVLPVGAERQAALAQYGLIHPLHRRLAEPEEIAEAVLFLASDDASLITGVAMPVDAGLSTG